MHKDRDASRRQVVKTVALDVRCETSSSYCSLPVVLFEWSHQLRASSGASPTEADPCSPRERRVRLHFSSHARDFYN
jgi:hypothetical protein